MGCFKFDLCIGEIFDFFIEVLLCELKMKEMLKFFYTVSDDYENI